MSENCPNEGIPPLINMLDGLLDEWPLCIIEGGELDPENAVEDAVFENSDRVRAASADESVGRRDTERLPGPREPGADSESC